MNNKNTKQRLFEVIEKIDSTFNINEKIVGKGIVQEYYCIIWAGDGYRVEAYQKIPYYDVLDAVKDAIKWAENQKEKTWVELIGRENSGNYNDIERFDVFMVDYKKIEKAQQKINSINQKPPPF